MDNKVTPPKETAFSRLLSRYIGESGCSVYKISQMTGLGRSAIQHTMSGKLIPARAFIDTLCSVLPITPFQREKLIELYQREKLGNRVYEARSAIKQMIESLSRFRYRSSPAPFQVDTELCGNEFFTVNGYENIITSIRNIVFSEIGKASPHICTTIPFRHPELFSSLYYIIDSSKNKVRLDHYFRIYKSDRESSGIENIRTLESALKFSICSAIEYRPFYHYGYKDTSYDFLIPLPYVLITSEYAIQISEDFISAFVTRDTGLRKLLSEQMTHIENNSELFIETTCGEKNFYTFAESAPFFKTSIEYQPCLTGFLTCEAIEKHLFQSPMKNDILSSVKKSFFSDSSCRKNGRPDYVVYFSKDGLDNFAQTGQMTNLPGILLTPFDPEERIAILTALKENTANFVMIDPDRLSLPHFIQIISLSNRKTVISCITEDKAFSCKLSEPLICADFEDFISSLCESEFTLDEQALLSAADSCIEKLQNGTYR